MKLRPPFFWVYRRSRQASFVLLGAVGQSLAAQFEGFDHTQVFVLPVVLDAPSVSNGWGDCSC